MKYFITLIIIFNSFYILNAANTDEGKAIFSTRCVSCHAIDKVLVGPALKNINQKRTEEWFIKFVTSSTKFIATGDAEANKIFNEFNKIPMPDHLDITTDQLKNIYEYIALESKNLETAPVINPIPRLADKQGNFKPISGSNIWIYWLWTGLTILLIIALTMCVKSKK